MSAEIEALRAQVARLTDELEQTRENNINGKFELHQRATTAEAARDTLLAEVEGREHAAWNIGYVAGAKWEHDYANGADVDPEDEPVNPFPAPTTTAPIGPTS